MLYSILFVLLYFVPGILYWRAVWKYLVYRHCKSLILLIVCPILVGLIWPVASIIAFIIEPLFLCLIFLGDFFKSIKEDILCCLRNKE